MTQPTVDRWDRDRTFHHSAFPPERVASERERSVSVCLPARNEARTIGPILHELMPLLDGGIVDQVVVVDDSEDRTGEIARAVGAEVHVQSELCARLGPVQGKGDAMWRALSVLWGDVVVYLDADSRSFGAHYATALAGVVAAPGSVSFAKGFYARPFESSDGQIEPHGGGRVTELCARPLLGILYPELAAVRQPLSGEVAADRELLESLPFMCGYSVDVALLIDTWRSVGLAGMAQVDLEVRQNRHRPISELGPMASAVAGAIVQRVRDDGRLADGGGGRFSRWSSNPAVAGEILERPPMAAWRRQTPMAGLK
jgi:glucosyl-3-phosphoglycerate synthase